MKLNKLVSTLNMEHSTWLQYRRKGVGGSDAGSICGLNPYSTAIAVFQDKVQQLPEKEDNESMRQGRDLEEYVARRFMEETGKRSAGQMQSSTKKNSHLCLQMLTV